MPKYKLSFEFTRFADGEIAPFGNNVCDCMEGNPVCPAPFIPIPQVVTLVTDYENALAAMGQGGPVATAVKNACREQLLDALRRNGLYVQAVAQNDLAKIRSTGYTVASTNRASVPLVAPLILEIENEMSTQLRLRIKAVPNAKAYEVRMRDDQGATWEAGGLFTSTRAMIVVDLTPGRIYTFQVRAVGGSTGFSAWSDPQSHMSL